MQKVFVMYKLKPGVTMEQYKKWSRTLDQVVTPHQPGVKRFQVFEIKGAEKGQPPYQVVEVVDVASWEAWQKCLTQAGMKQVVEEWESYGDGTTSVMLFGEEI